MLNLIKTSTLEAIFGKTVNFGVKAQIIDAKSDPFIPFEVDLF